MVRSILATVLLVGVVIWTPFWVQCVLFALAVVWMRYRLLCLVPAILADVLYAPTDSFGIANFKMTLIVLAMISVWSIIIRQTRLADVV